jgi:hypothetical protein
MQESHSHTTQSFLECRLYAISRLVRPSAIRPSGNRPNDAPSFQYAALDWSPCTVLIAQVRAIALVVTRGSLIAHVRITQYAICQYISACVWCGAVRQVLLRRGLSPRRCLPNESGAGCPSPKPMLSAPAPPHVRFSGRVGAHGVRRGWCYTARSRLGVRPALWLGPVRLEPVEYLQNRRIVPAADAARSLSG